MYEDDYDNGDMEDDFVYSEYTTDDTLDGLSRLEKYCIAEFSLQRLVLVRDLYDTAIEAGYEECVKRLLPLLKHFVSDPEPAVRQVFADQLFPLATFFVENCNESSKGYQSLINIFIPYSFELVVDKNMDVSQVATEALIKISKLLKKEDIKPQLLSVVINLAHDKGVEEYRIAAAKLFNELSAIFGEQICRDIVTPEIIVLSSDSSLLVRKAVGQNFGKMCKIIGTENTVNKLLPTYLMLAKDEIWGVRKACAESLPQVSSCLNNENKNNLVSLFKSYAEDVSRWVKNEAMKQLGVFIATFKDCDVPNELIKHFVGIIQSGEQNNDQSDLIEHCAYNFPAVVYTLGKNRWNLLENAFVILTKHSNWKVRRTLSYSLHEIASILGEEYSERYLLPVFEMFAKDVDEVKLGVMSTVAKILKNVSQSARNKYLNFICTLPEENENWRIRNEIGKQIGDLCYLYTPQQINQNIVAKLVVSLLCDSFAEVRETAAQSSGPLLKKLLSDGEEKQFCQYLNTLAKGKSYFQRQLFIKICQSLFKNVDAKYFESEFLPNVVKLANDKVANVRLAVATLINNHMIQHEDWKEHSKIFDLRLMFKQDKDRDVKYFSSFVSIVHDGSNSFPIQEQDEPSYDDQTPSHTIISSNNHDNVTTKSIPE